MTKMNAIDCGFWITEKTHFDSFDIQLKAVFPSQAKSLPCDKHITAFKWLFANGHLYFVMLSYANAFLSHCVKINWRIGEHLFVYFRHKKQQEYTDKLKKAINIPLKERELHQIMISLSLKARLSSLKAS